ncbi:MAG: sigma-70 family RNA polymerase sigma factor [Planctomycetes bacterium]|nr:sigma-70 family RNA polymerase sigma factor [Planctomycetota bacterium]
METEERVLGTGPARPDSFFRNHVREVYSFISRKTGAPPCDVEDLLQECFLHAWLNRDRFRNECSTLTWLLEIAKNKIRDRWRARRRRALPPAIMSALTEMDRAPIPDEVLQKEEVGALVRRAMQQLDEPYFDVLMRRHCHGHSVSRIAADLAESEDAVESRLRRAREALRKLLVEVEANDA